MRLVSSIDDFKIGNLFLFSHYVIPKQYEFPLEKHCRNIVGIVSKVGAQRGYSNSAIEYIPLVVGNDYDQKYWLNVRGCEDRFLIMD